MAEKFTIEYDEQFNKIDIYKRYKFLMPFIGLNYNSNNKRILFIGESHFLPTETYSRIDNINLWYKKTQNEFNFSDLEESYLNTRNIISNDVIDSGYQNNSHSIYRNLGNEFANCFGHGDYNDSLKYISFYNYFLRPAEGQGDSLEPSWDDDVMSFLHLVEIDKILIPDAIIMASKKARDSFDIPRSHKKYGYLGDDVADKIFYVPHPANAWWNNEFSIKNNYWNPKIKATTKEKINGKDKLSLILRSL
jgi:hypothetical protein